MRADRLLGIAMTLRPGRVVPARELASKFEVSERTIYRDVDVLSSMGVPVMVQRGGHGGITLLREFRSDLSGLSHDEARALSLLSSPRAFEKLGLRGQFASALAKLVASLPQGQRDGAFDMQNRLLVDTAGWFEREEHVPLLHDLSSAISACRTLRFTYTRRDASRKRYSVRPYGLVAKQDRWYLVGESKRRMRVFRVSRIDADVVTGRPFQRKAGFDLRRFWEKWVTDFLGERPEYWVTFRLSRNAEAGLSQIVAGDLARSLADAETDSSGWHILRWDFERELYAMATLLPFGSEVEVLTPEPLCRRLAEAGMGVVGVYATAESGD